MMPTAACATIKKGIHRFLFMASLLAGSLALLGFAQASDLDLPIGRGHYLLGGSYQASRSVNAGDGTGWLNLSPEFRYFVLNGLSIGAEASVSWASSYTYRSISPILNYYFLPQDRWVPFVVLMASLSHGDTYGGPYDSHSGSVGVGASFFFNSHVAFSPKIALNFAEYQSAWLSTSGAFEVFF
jgi:hypothetical protein